MSLAKTISFAETTSRSGDIFHLTVLDQELFILHYNCQDIEVYESKKFRFKRRMKVNGMTMPYSIASCSVNKCLYTVVLEYQGHLCGLFIDLAIELDLHLGLQTDAILRIDPSNGNLIKVWKTTHASRQLSVASDTNVIVCPFSGPNLYEYTADGELVRVINLGRNPVDMTPLINPGHVVKLDNGLFVVCQYDPGEVYLLATKETSSTSGRIDEVEILKKFGDKSESYNYKLCLPGSLSVGKEGSILFTDTYYDRVVLLNSNFDKARIINSKEFGFKKPKVSCFNESTGEWFVTDGRRILVFQVEGDTIDIQIHYLSSH